jgi:hypothetical protein
MSPSAENGYDYVGQAFAWFFLGKRVIFGHFRSPPFGIENRQTTSPGEAAALL